MTSDTSQIPPPLSVSNYLNGLSLYTHKSFISTKWCESSIELSTFHLGQCFPKSAPRTTSGPPYQLKWSSNLNTNQYFVFRGALKYFWWSAHRKSLGTTDLGTYYQYGYTKCVLFELLSKKVLVDRKFFFFSFCRIKLKKYKRIENKRYKT